MFYVKVIASGEVYQLILSLSGHLCGVWSQLKDLPMAGVCVTKKEPKWLPSRPACADMNSAMQEVTDIESATNGQHVNSSQSILRLRRDDKDIQSLLSFLLSRYPFACDEMLGNIRLPDVMADGLVNSNRAKDIPFLSPWRILLSRIEHLGRKSE